MSAPVQSNGSADNPELYAPPRERETAAVPPQSAEISDAVATGSNPGDPAGGQETMPLRSEATPDVRLPRGLGGPNIPMPAVRPRLGRVASPPAADSIGASVPPQSEAWDFEGDKPPHEIRYPLPFDPEIPSKPLMRRQSIRWFATVAVAAAIVAGGVTFVSLIETRTPLIKREMVPAATQLVASLPASPSQPTPRLIVEGRRTFTNEALPIGVGLKGATGNELAFLSGLLAGTRLSVGGPHGANGWRIPVRELDGALAFAPKDFVGVMDAAIDLRLPNDFLLDSQAMRLEWIRPKQPESRPTADRSQDAKTAA